MTFHFMYPTPLPSTKGWGPGWPNCQPEANDGPSIFWPGVHPQIAELVSLLVAECERQGFFFMDPGCWGYGCRGTKDSSGNTSGTPSFHSWGLACDVNAPRNPFGADRGDTELGQPEMAWFIALWRKYGFFWLGPAIGDWMHFSFCGSPADAKKMTELARRELGDSDEMAYADFKEGVKSFWRGEPQPVDEDDFAFGWRFARDARTHPRSDAHDHEGYAKTEHGHSVRGTAT